MFNFYKKSQTDQKKSQPNQQEQQDDKEIVAAITYYISKNDDDVKVDVEIDNLNNVGIDNLCKILNVLAEDRAYTETVSIIKTNLEAEGDEAKLLRFIVQVSQQIGKNFIKQAEDIITNQPCIRPSDMLK
jgi:hypothetical protein